MAEPIAQPVARGHSPRRRLTISWVRVASILTGLLIWELLGRAQVSLIIPSASETVLALAQMIEKGDLARNLAASLGSFFIGFVLAVLVGVLLGALMAIYPVVEYFCDIWISAGMSAPTLAFLPILVILFGINENVRIAVAFTFSVWVMVVNTFTALRGVDHRLVEMAHAFGATPRQIFWRILLPGGLALIISGLRLGAGRAVKGMVNGEMLITIVGLGAMIQTYAATYNGPNLFAVLTTICTLAILIDQGLRALHRAAAPWNQRR